ncbi:MAG TPA: VOC family protein [Dehalococcoidia bacterium]|nr:VOC family protein [Dehalococcoidia bacterium]
MTTDSSGAPDPIDLGDLTVVLNLSDLAQSVDFYTRLGFERTEVHGHDGERPISSKDNPNCATFRAGRQEVHLMRIGMNMLNFAVGEPKAVMAELQARGLEATPAGPDDSGTSLADPDGNIIYIMKRPPPGS